ncbi:MAG: hypothetical protein K2O03_04480 [Lachnospiraceae bacterium]|nr:hypothetical protein [Lachnospiraceae bacterium]
MNDKRRFFQNFYPEILTSKQGNKQLVNEFVATGEGKSLEDYLKNKAWKADLEGETKVYFVKDQDGSVALFFSIKCGLLYKNYQYDGLESDRLDFVNMLVEAMLQKDTELLNRYYDSGMYDFQEMDRLFKIANRRVDLKMEDKELQDNKYTLKVEECYSAIEIHHFCRNSMYKKDGKTGIPLGFGLFWEVVVPLVCDITNKIGCKYLYLFAADQTSSGDVKKLVQYYKNDLKFSDVEDMMLIKPYYDKGCLGLVQAVSDLQYNRNAVWEEFSDV